MVQLILIGFGAGMATALLVASITSGAVFSLLLFQLAALPILIAALGWSHWAGLIAAASAAGILATVLTPALFFSFLISIGLPAWWLGYLTLLARPTASAPETMEWYPVGRLVIWTAILGAGTVIAAIGVDEASFRDSLGKAFSQTLQMFMRSGHLSGVSEDDLVKIVPLLVAIFPAVAAIMATTINLLNLWLAARIVNVSGRLKRPWPRLAEMQFPVFVSGLFAIAIGASFLPGIAGTIAGVFSASLSIAYGVLGFAVLHAVTLAKAAARPWILGLSYLAVLSQGWPLLLFILLGVAETIFDFRARVAASRPPASRTQ
jgi:hypothetical protein